MGMTKPSPQRALSALAKTDEDAFQVALDRVLESGLLAMEEVISDPDAEHAARISAVNAVTAMARQHSQRKAASAQSGAVNIVLPPELTIHNAAPPTRPERLIPDELE